jgi:UDP-N-acetylmuramoyl-tripeptide--D-alanyl-D-alanine ligase
VACGFSAAQTKFFETAEEAAEFLRGILVSGDLLLVKGSRGVKMERIVESLIAQHAAPGEFSGQELKH